MRLWWGPGEHLDRLHCWSVAGDRPVVVAVGADQIGQHLGVPAGGLSPGGAMATPIAADHLGIDRIDLVAGRHQRPDQQAMVGLDPDRHLSWVLGMGCDQGVQLANAGQAIGDPPSRQELPSWSSRHRSWWASPQSTPTNSMASSFAPSCWL
jgi:hypothetical protein